MKNVIVLLMLSAGMAGCDSDSPVTPTGPAAPVPGPVVSSVRGGVSDSAYRPLPGARVEVTSGPHAGKSTIANSSGDYSLDGPFDELTEFRATKDGYTTAVRTLRTNVNCPTCAKWFVHFALDVPAPPVNISGDYRLTFAADSACDLPLEASRRTFVAEIRPIAREDRAPSTSFDVTFPGTAFFEDYNSFQIHVAGDYLSFNLEDSHGPWFIERLAPKTYFGIGGEGSVSVGTSVSTISIPFKGTIHYCEATAEMKGYYDCSAAKPVVHKGCTSQNHRLMLERR